MAQDIFVKHLTSFKVKLARCHLLDEVVWEKMLCFPFSNKDGLFLLQISIS